MLLSHQFLPKEFRRDTHESNQEACIDLTISLPARTLAWRHHPGVMRTQGSRERLDGGSLPCRRWRGWRGSLSRAQEHNAHLPSRKLDPGTIPSGESLQQWTQLRLDAAQPTED